MHSILGDTKNQEILLPGAQYRNGYRALVVGVLGTAEAPPVTSRGALFYNKDRWTVRALITAMCQWAKNNPGCTPLATDVQTWVTEANNFHVPPREREIVIANTPEVLPLRTYSALLGGASHEAFHTLYSARRDLTLEEVATVVLPRWARVKDWSRYTEALLHWSNIVEDIRNERRGREEFEALYVNLCDLQDFILIQEETLGQQKEVPVASVAQGVFRDLGLGYNTEKQREAFTGYKKNCPEAVAFVMKGPLAPQLSEAINLTREDDLGNLRVAMDILINLGELAKTEEQEEQAKENQAGDGKQSCPQCGASAGHLIVRPLSDGQGHKVPGKGVVTCSVCGFQTVVDVEKKASGPSDPSPQKESPLFEGFENETDENSGQGKQSGTSDPSPETKKPSEKESEPKDPAGTENPQSTPQESIQNCSFEEAAKNAGGSHAGENLLAGHDWANIAAQLATQKGPAVLDVSTALEQNIQTLLAKEDKGRKDEKPWAPYNTSSDLVNIVKPSLQGISHDREIAKKLLATVKAQTVYLRSRLRTIIRSLEQTRTIHGVPTGRKLSTRFLVDSKVALQAGQQPTHAYCKRSTRVNMKMAAAIVMDESGSMFSDLITAAQIFIALAEPLDGLGFPVLALGFRNKETWNWHDNKKGADTARPYHRYDGVIYDIFKGWNERFQSILWRFANTRADGGTPMADGVQFALTALQARSETQRFLFVVTDGLPDSGHVPVLNRQLRIAKEAGIHVIGVGIGKGAIYVQTLFPDHVWANTVSEFPKLLVAKLNSLVDARLCVG